jgi:hypothetical protein
MLVNSQIRFNEDLLLIHVDMVGVCHLVGRGRDDSHLKEQSL